MVFFVWNVVCRVFICGLIYWGMINNYEESEGYIMSDEILSCVKKIVVDYLDIDDEKV